MPRTTSQSKLNNERSMKRFGKRFSKVLTKMFWHFNEAIPNYSSMYRKASIDKTVSNSHSQLQQQPATADKNPDRISYTKGYQPPRRIRRISTLTSIKEENENEIMNCK